MAEFVNARRFAKLVGVSHTAVNKAIKNGRLARSVRTKNRGRGFEIEIAIGKVEWSSNVDAAQQREPEVRAGGTPKGERPPEIRTTPVQGALYPGSEAGAEFDPSKHTPDAANARRQRLFDAQTVRVGYQARLAKLEFEEKSGALVNVEEVRAHAFTIARRTRERLQQIPERLAATVAAETDTDRVLHMIRREIDDALEALGGLAAAATVTAPAEETPGN